MKLRHKALAEGHYLSVRFALRIEVRAALAAADRKSGQGILEDLLKAQELDNTKVNRGMKSETSLVGADGRIELNTERVVYLNLSLIVYPGNPEQKLSLGSNQTL